MIIHYLHAPAGGGKTHAIVGQIADMVQQGKNVILCQQTKKLIEETSRQLTARYEWVEQKVIVSGPDRNNVLSDIMGYHKNPCPEPHVLILTWEAFQRSSFIPAKNNWHMIVDEIPQAYDCFDEALQKHIASSRST